MRKNYLILFSACFILIKLHAQISPKVYIHLNSHNEADALNEPYEGTTSAYFDTAYKYIKRIADSVISKKAKYNFQSDVGFLLGDLKWDPKSAATSNLNLVKWMDNSPYIECDPHCHEGKYGVGPLAKFYNYSDCAHLHDSLGVTNRKNVGGCKIDGLQNGNYWRTLENGQAGVRYSTSGLWKPNVLWGGSYKSGVHNDVNTFGCWKPQDSINYGTHVATRRLRLQGNGCSMVFQDTTNEQRIIKELVKIFTRVKNGTYPNTEFYTQVLQFNCRNVGSLNFVPRLCTILDSINVYVAKGWVEWKTITEKDQLWYTHPLDSSYKRLDCVNLPTGIEEKFIKNNLAIYPNPSSDRVFIEYHQPLNKVKVIDATGKLVYFNEAVHSEKLEIPVNSLKHGIYFISVQIGDEQLISRKLIIE